MNFLSIVILSVVVIAFLFAIFKTAKRKTKGCSFCCGDCEECKNKQ